jgi:KUP system potassium uptake protein
MARKRTRSGTDSARIAALSLAAVGIVFGDIGTSPLYAFRQALHDLGGAGAPDAVLGVLSLIFWSLIIVITGKYVLFLMRADYKGEGGVLVLAALLKPPRGRPRGRRRWLIPLGVLAAALLYADGTITPAISVLSAIEGLGQTTTAFDPFVVPLTVAILALLFMAQRRGTEGIGRVFGPVIVVWFATLGALGARAIVAEPSVLWALDPARAVMFFVDNGWLGFVVLGSVFLVVTGGEALYADLGHFGRLPIRIAWFAVALPGLILNYFGQGAAVLAAPEAARHPFYALAPPWAHYPLVALATVATVIASQAIISGAFSLTRQAFQLDFLPRVKVVHTHGEEEGQIYLPIVNWLLMAAAIGLVVGFGSSSNLASAYGIAVSANMVITTVLVVAVAHRRRWNLWVTGALAALFLVIDLAFLGANLLKIETGGWYAVGVGAILFLVMMTWWQGRELQRRRVREKDLKPEQFFARLEESKPKRVPGTAVFLAPPELRVPPPLTHFLEYGGALHKRVVLMGVEIMSRPRVPAGDRLRCEELEHGFVRLVARYGFMQSPNVPLALRFAKDRGVLDVDADQVTYFIGRQAVVPSAAVPGMFVWREHLYALLVRNALPATTYFHIPPQQVLEIGIQVQI